MSIKADNVEQDLNVKELLSLLLLEIKMLRLHMEVITDQRFVREDVENED